MKIITGCLDKIYKAIKQSKLHDRGKGTSVVYTG